MKESRTLIVIADGAHARFFVHEGPGKGLRHLPKQEMKSDTPAGRDLMADRPGRTFASGSEGRSAMEPKSDPRDLVEKEFARTVAERIDTLMAKGTAGRLIIAADPRSLGELRKAVSPQTSITATLDK
ncbi:MAG: host attachment protein, partial [Pseudomonadota bacterium]|nr:host attachment protein [Pseudomonadota bacterium]